MLVHLGVRDLAIVDNLELDLGPGMTVLSGETGAGKSLLVDALELAVGGRASAELVRAGAQAAEVNAVFEPGPAARAWLAERELAADPGECIVRRTVSAQGRSRAFVNGRPIPVGDLRSLGARLVDVHGQHAHQALLDASHPRTLLDTFGEHRELLAGLARSHTRIRELQREIDALEGDERDPGAHLEFLRFQIAELEAQPVGTEDLRRIADEHRRLAHAAELLAAVSHTQTLIADDTPGAGAALHAARRGVEGVMRLDERLAEVHELLAQGQSLLADAAQALRRYGDDLQMDEARLSELDRTLQRVHDLARKHRCGADALEARLHDLRAEVESLEGGAARLARAMRERDALVREWRAAAAEVHRQRTATARRLEAAVEEVLAQLGMAGASIHFEVDHDPQGPTTPHGLDSVVLKACTNPGQPPLPLNRVASGGELSRIALAIHAVALHDSEATTLVFDEVDAGVGGAVAEMVGRRMRAVGSTRQVLAVTHLPQVAALAHGHVLVEKEHDSGGRRSRIRTLAGDERERELARMLGGMAITERTLAHAREMLDAGRAASTADGGGNSRPAA
jgi:DNA repair protein RecN (Recombination protein N)